MTADRSRTAGRLIIAGLVILLIVLHQDVWNWDSRTLVFGFMPLTLFYHVCLSVAAASTWLLATKISWFDDDAASPADPNDGGTGGAE